MSLPGAGKASRAAPDESGTDEFNPVAGVRAKIRAELGLPRVPRSGGKGGDEGGGGGGDEGGGGCGDEGGGGGPARAPSLGGSLHLAPDDPAPPGGAGDGEEAGSPSPQGVATAARTRRNAVSPAVDAPGGGSPRRPPRRHILGCLRPGDTD